MTVHLHLPGYVRLRNYSKTRAQRTVLHTIVMGRMSVASFDAQRRYVLIFCVLFL